MPLTRGQIEQVLRTGDDQLQALLALAHEVRLKYQGPSVEVEGIVSRKTGGCPEDCHFCSQSGQFTSPVRSVWLNIPELVRAAKATAATGASEFCIVAAVRGPTTRPWSRCARAWPPSAPPSTHQRRRVARDAVARAGRRPRRHGRAPLQPQPRGRPFVLPQVVTTHSFEERWDTCLMVKESGMELCCGGLVGMGETLEQRAEARRTGQRGSSRTRCR